MALVGPTHHKLLLIQFNLDKTQINHSPGKNWFTLGEHSAFGANYSDDKELSENSCSSLSEVCPSVTPITSLTLKGKYYQWRGDLRSNPAWF